MTERPIKKMPDQATLEAFLEGMSGSVKVIFDINKGEFEWLDPSQKPDPMLGKPKTQLGEDLKRL